LPHRLWRRPAPVAAVRGVGSYLSLEKNGAKLLLFCGALSQSRLGSTMHKEDTDSTRGHTLERGGDGAHWVGCAGVPGGTR
jgi:hypothetical protein